MLAKNQKDAYDFDNETVSDYDAAPKNTKFDWGASNPAGDMLARSKKDAYDFDPETVSSYDADPKNTKFDWGASKPVREVSMNDLSQSIAE